MEYKELIEKIVRDEHNMPSFTITGVREVPCTKPGDNYMSVVTVLEVEGKNEGELFSTSMFLKRLIDSSTAKHDFGMEEAFHNEGVMYKQILPLLGAPEQFARCYHVQRDRVVLQDLRRDGYKMAERRTGFDFNTAKNILKELSRFHAVSFKEITSKNNEFLKAVQLLTPIGIALSSSKNMVELCLQRIIKTVQNCPDLADILPALGILQGRVGEHLKALSKSDKVAVLCHGDFWLNNILSHPSGHIRIVDLQACGVHSAAVDVWTFLYSSLQNTGDNTSLDTLISEYCTDFLDNLLDLDLTPNRMPTIDTLKEEILSKELYGFLVASVYLPARYIIPEGISRYERNTTEESDEYHDQLFEPEMKDAICNMVRTCKRRGLFKK